MIEKFLSSRFLTLYLIPFILGLITVFSFQPFNLLVLNFIVLPIIFYLIVYIKKKSKSTYRKKPYKKNLFTFGTTFGFGFFLSGIHWITNSLTFDENFRVLIPIALIFIPLFLSLFFSITFLIIGPLLSYNFTSIFLFACSLSFSDYLRSKILTGFPWNLWAYSFSWTTEIIQILNLIGLFAFNLISLTLFLIPSVIYLNTTFAKKLLFISIIPFILFSFYIYGNYSINHNYKLQNSNETKTYIKVVSPNFNLEYDLSLQDINQRLDKLIRFSDPDKNTQTLFVWPEGVFSGYSLDELYHFKEKFSKVFSSQHYILFGVNILDQNLKGYYNSLIIVDNKFNVIKEYKKQKLVPFGEFLPLENLLEKFGLKKITEGYGSFLKAKNQSNLIINKINILPLICYEIIFTELIQKSDKNTNLIINISEDGWFGNSIGPDQHFAKSIFRAIEQDSYLVRSANKGISAIINNKGEIVKKLGISEAGNIDLEVPIMSANKRNKNDLIFFLLLFTYVLLFNFYKKKNVK